MRVLVTGASGFVGSELVRQLARAEYRVRAVSRRALDSDLADLAETVTGLDMEADDSRWREALQGVDVVIHAAARVHVMSDAAADPLAEFRRSNVSATLRIARLAHEAGARRFVLVSSIKVNGEGTVPGRPYRATDLPQPMDAYGQSKWEAEQALRALEAETGLGVVVVRPTLVYGPGAKGNLATLMRILAWGLPLPLGAVRNRRSMVSRSNLCDVLVRCVDHPAAPGQCFLLSDACWSTPELIARLAEAGAGPARLWRVPLFLLTWPARMLGRQAWVQRLCGDLEVDASLARDLLDWVPVVAPVSELAAMVRAAKQEKWTG